MELDLFGIKIGGGDSDKVESTRMVEHKISKTSMLNRLGFQPEKVVFIQYDYKAGVLIVKQRE